jgi:hypothetical protein
MSGSEKSVADLEAQFVRCTKGSLDAIHGLAEKGALGKLDELWRRLSEYVNFMGGVLDQNK